MSLRTFAVMSYLTLAVATISPLAMAQKCDLQNDRCSGKPLSDAELDNTLFLGDKVNKQLHDLDKMESAQGRDLKAVLIGRMGSNLKKFRVLDDTQNGQSLSLHQLLDILKADSKYYLQNQDGAYVISNQSDSIAVRSIYSRLTEKELKYSHLGIALKNYVVKNKNGVAVTGPGTGQWAVLHLLYSCDDQKISHIFQGTVFDFFYDHMHDYGSQILVPTQDVQDNMQEIIVNRKWIYNWQTNHYNALARFDSLSEQNSNQFVLEALAASMYQAGEIRSRPEAIQVLKSHGFSPSRVTPTGLYGLITAPGISKIISSMMPTVCFASQPEIKKYSIGEIVSALSVQEFLRKNKKLQSAHEIMLNANERSAEPQAQNAQ